MFTIFIKKKLRLPYMYRYYGLTGRTYRTQRRVSTVVFVKVEGMDKPVTKP